MMRLTKFIPIVMAIITLICVSNVGSQTIDERYRGQYNPLLAGTTCGDATLNGAISSAPGKTIHISPVDRAKVACTWNLTENVTANAAQTLVVPKGAMINIGAGVTLSACIDAGDYAIFTGAGSLLIPEACVNDVRAAWWVKTGFGLAQADAAANASGRMLTFANDTWSITGNMPLLSNYRFEKGAMLNIANTITVASNTCPEAGAYKIFDLVGSGKITVNQCVEMQLAWWGFTCDDVTNNSLALNAAQAALPLTGGQLTLPASQSACSFNTTLTFDKPIYLRGAGGAGTSKADVPAETTLVYTGSGTAIDLPTSLTRGSVLEGFELNHTGTAAIGIWIRGGNSSKIRGVSFNSPTVKFSQAAIVLGDAAGSITHSHTIENSIITNAAPDGIQLTKGINYVLFNNTINHHSACNIDIGETAVVKDVHIMLNRIENTFVGQTDAWSICARNVEALWVTHNHFEVATGANGIFRTGSGDTQCEHCVFNNNQVNLTPNAIPGDGLVYLDAPGANPAAYFYAQNNRIEDNRVSPPTTAFVELGNTGGNGGASIVALYNNEVTAALNLVSDVTRIHLAYEHQGNWSIGDIRDRNNFNFCRDFEGVGNVGAGIDNLMPACGIVRNRIHASGVGFRLIAAGDTGANANLKQVRIVYEGTEVFTTGAVAANNIAWRIECNGVRSATTSMRVFCQGNPLTAAGNIKTTYTTVTGLTFSAAQSIQVTGESVADNDIQQFYQFGEIIQQ